MPEFGRHPARLAAIRAGEKKWRGPACAEHGDALRHSSSGQCVACNRQRSAIQAMAKSHRRERYVKLADRPDRLAAVARGALIYWGPLCPNGHAGARKSRSPRYTRSARCVACARGHGRNATRIRLPACDIPAAVSSAVPSDIARRAPAAPKAAESALKALRQTAGRLRAIITRGR